ncbi:MAG: ATP-binding protein [Chromatiaceae bacterium]|nr:MAG: ATP-binding protein [Chromatiaceae bacterium]
MTGPERNPFALPAEPRTGRALIWWAFFEWPGLEAFSRRIGRGRGLLLYLRAMPWIMLLATIPWLLGLWFRVGLELPLRFPDQFRAEWTAVFWQHQDVLGRMIGLIALSWWGVALGMASALLLSAPVALIGRVPQGRKGETAGLALSVSTALVFALAVGWIFGWVRSPELRIGSALEWDWGGRMTWARELGPAEGLAVGLAMMLPFGLATGLPLVLPLGRLSRLIDLRWGLVASLPVGGLAVGLAWVSAWSATGLVVGYWIGALRLPFYLPEALAALVRLDLRHNPYLRDAGVWLPFWGARRRLTNEARQDPATGTAFADFLLEHRPWQRTLAAEVLHAVAAGQWAMQPLEPLALRAPRLVADAPRWRPSDDWLADLAALREQLTAARHRTQPGLHRDAQGEFIRRLDAFRQRTLAEPPRWARHYLDAIDLWRAEAAKELTRLEDQARRLEPITANVYRPGDSLRPGPDAELFLGRQDLQEELARVLLTPRELPLLLLQGQRRVGKTSLLNFLPDLLGPGFRVVHQDLQAGTVISVPTWLTDLRRRVAAAINAPPDDWRAPADWLAGWVELEPWLADAARRCGRRLILAFDEYEELHKYLAEEPARGARLLAAIRAFTQRQAQVCLLFAGAAPFSDLRDPDWAHYFVQAVRLRVDYLDQPSALALITKPVPSLRYPPEVPARLWRLTRGHPALLQRLCKELVDIANRDGRQAMTMADLDAALARGIDKETAPMERFWNDFCRAPACRDCIEALLAGQDPDADPALIRARLRLAEHGYILAADGRWQLRVPLFEDWLRRYRLAFD